MTAPFGAKFLQPDPDGSLSNSVTPTFKMRYATTRGSADPAGQVQFVGTRVGRDGVANQTPQNVLLSGWLGAPTLTNLPRSLRDFGVAQFRSRVYVVGGMDSGGVARAEVYSAPLNGGSVGTWRQEKSMAVRPRVNDGGQVLAARYGPAVTAATFGNTGGTGSAVGGAGGSSWLICYGGFEAFGTGTGNNASATMIAAPILDDGVLGNWITIAYTGWSQLGFAHLLAAPSQYNTSCLILSGGIGVGNGAGVANAFVSLVRNAPAGAQSGYDWDVPGGWMQSLPSSGLNSVCSHSMSFDWANGNLLLWKGANNTSTAWTGFLNMGFNVDVVNWTWASSGTWATGTSTGSPTAQTNHGMVYFGAQSAGSRGGSPVSYVYLIGGNSSFGNSDNTTPLSQVQIGTLTWNTSNVPSAVWSTGTALGTAVTGCRSVVCEQYPQRFPPVGYPPWTDPNKVWMINLGGSGAAYSALAQATSLTAVAGGSGSYTTSGGANSSWVSGTGAGLASGDLGSGGVVAASTASDAPAGAQDVTYVYGATGSPLALAAGDLVQMSAQFTDKVGGDPSPLRTSIIRIGNAPTISNLAVSSLTTGQPVISLAWNSGTGGQGEASWRIVVTRNSDSVVMFDSGIKIDQLNSVQVVCAPMLANVLYNVVATVTSLDLPVPGATDTATSSTSFTPTLAAAVGVPSSVAAAGDATGKWVLLTGTAAASTTGVRLYYRRTGSGQAMQLYADNVAAAPGALSFKLMDRLALGVQYDFAISALGGSAQTESALSSIVTATIPADAQSPSAYLHLAGQPLTGALGVQVLMEAWPKMSLVTASATIPKFNAARPVGRQGVLNYRVIELSALSVHSANLATFDSIIDAALTGGVLFYRDRRGTIFPAILNTPSGISGGTSLGLGGGDVQMSYPDHTALTMRLIQVDDTYAPSVSNGAALGIPTLVSGSLPPLSGARTELVA